ncbi:MAG: ATP-dependent helicase [Cellulosilyticum sp.]|nr:ATP-dependent helicase [Cellulosilyticum sp.]
MNLNTNQLKAVTCDLKPTIVIAGPGSGKTQVIVNRIQYMLTQLNCSPRQILVVTFSKMAAEEMKERYFHLFGDAPITFGTLHSVFYRILRKSQPSRYDLEKLLLEDKRKVLLTQLLKEMDTDEGDEFLDGFIKHLSLMKNQLIVPNLYQPNGISKPVFIELLSRYEAYKERHGLFDFDDMLVECYYLLKNDSALCHAVSEHYKYILVDEFQDINLVQFEILRLIVSHHEHLFVVGDDDQSIYQFRGAKPSYLLDFKRQFKEVNEIYLDVNYRCSGSILQHSLALINQNTVRYQKQLTTPNPKGETPQIVYCKDAKEEAMHIVHEISSRRQKGISLKQMAVIYRTNIQARPIVETLLAANIPFCLRDGMLSLYDQWITKDILSYLHLAKCLDQTDLAYRIINKPKRYISKVSMEIARKGRNNFLFNLLEIESLTEWQKNYIQELLFDLQVLREKPLLEAIRYIRHHIGYDQYLNEYAAYRKMPVMSLFEVLEDIEDSAQNYHSLEEWENALIDMATQIKQTTKKNSAETLTLTTMHGAKGLEFDTVFIIDVIDGMIPYHKSVTPQEIEEERRLLYVGMTRAKTKLLLYVPSQKHGKAVQSSPFIDELNDLQMKEKFVPGKKIKHRKLGTGKIIEVLDKNMIVLQFKNGQQRKIDGHYCINNAIIAWEDEDDEKN